MKKAKAVKHLGYARESLEFWREKYVQVKRSNNSMMDIKWHMSLDGKTIRECELEEAIREMNEAKELIAKYERIAK